MPEKEGELVLKPRDMLPQIVSLGWAISGVFFLPGRKDFQGEGGVNLVHTVIGDIIRDFDDYSFREIILNMVQR